MLASLGAAVFVVNSVGDLRSAHIYFKLLVVGLDAWFLAFGLLFWVDVSNDCNSVWWVVAIAVCGWSTLWSRCIIILLRWGYLLCFIWFYGRLVVSLIVSGRCLVSFMLRVVCTCFVVGLGVGAWFVALLVFVVVVGLLLGLYVLWVVVVVWVVRLGVGGLIWLDAVCLWFSWWFGCVMGGVDFVVTLLFVVSCCAVTMDSMVCYC